MKRFAMVSRMQFLGTLVALLYTAFPQQGNATKVGYSLPEYADFNISLNEVDQYPMDGIRKVVLDAGHGGKDGGCSGKHSIEKDIALDITLRLGQMIKNNFDDVEVIYTRDRDEFIPLHERANIANRNQADLFISIHCNTTPKRNSAQGTETFVLGLHRAEDNLAVAKRENSVITQEEDYQKHYGGYDPNSDEGHITLSMYQNAFLDQSIALANFIEDEFTNHGNRVSRGVKQAGFLVLRNTVMPSVLIETGFLNHSKEESFLTSEAGKAKIASAIFNAFSKYKYDVDHMVALQSSDQDKIEAIPASYQTTNNQAQPVAQETSSQNFPAGDTPPVNYVEKAKREMERMKSLKSEPQKEMNAKEDRKGQLAAAAKPAVARMSESPTSQTKPPKPGVSAQDASPAESNTRVQPREKKLEYVVQLSASNQKIKSSRGPKWDKVQNEVLIRFENNLYKYQIGELASYDAAVAKKDTLRSLGFQDCFIVAYYDDHQISVKDALKLIK